jgi:hypothetical protein
MLYGFRDGDEWVVVAADTTEELDTFSASMNEVDAFSLMVNDDYRGLNRAYRIAVTADAPVMEITKFRAADVQKNMRESDPAYEDPYAHDSKDERTIAEIYGLDKHDPWDTRTDEHKAKDEEHKAKIEDYKKGKAKGDNKNLSGESFSAAQRGSVGVTGVRGYRDQDGKITITDVMAQKGLWDEREEEAPLLVDEPGVYLKVLCENTLGNSVSTLNAAIMETRPDFSYLYAEEVEGEDNSVFYIMPDEDSANALVDDLRDILVHVGKVSIETVDERGQPSNKNRIFNETFKTFYRLDVHGIDEAGFDLMIEALPALEIDKMIVQRGTFDEDGSTGVWTASGIKRLALKIEDAFKSLDSSITTEVYAVNADNERLSPKGVEVVDTTAPREIGPRPWNDRADDWYALTDDERAEEIKKNVKGDEFIFAGSWDQLKGALMYIAPKDYFDATGEMWLKESLPITHLLPPEWKEVSPGVYNSYASDGWVQTAFRVAQRGIRESWFLRIYLNNLDL